MEETQASQIANRIALHERSRAQRVLLDLLQTVPLGQMLVLRGSGALHGVHLKQERVAWDLDFLTDAQTHHAFFENPARFDLPLTLVATKTGDGRMGAYRHKGKLFPNILVNMDMTPASRGELEAFTTGRFADVGGVRSSVLKVQSLETILAQKVRCMHTRDNLKSSDFVDFWLGLQRFTDWDALRCAARPYAILPDTRNTILRHLEAVAVDWETTLGETMRTVPSYALVRDDLRNWLPQILP